MRSEKAASKPNILLVMTDQMRSTVMGCAGVEQVSTPALDRLASQGSRFTNAIANTPACTPSRATLFTGKHVLKHGLVNNDMQLGHDHQSLAHCLGQAGYQCSYIGKWHMDGENRGANIPPGPRRQGFDDFWAGVECNHHYFQGYYYPDSSDQPTWLEGYEPDAQTDLAIDYLRRRAPESDPFFMVLSWGPPHCPYQLVPESFRAMVPPDSFDLLPNAIDSGYQDPATIGQASHPLQAPAEEVEARKRRVIADYYAQVTALDACFERLMKALEDQGLDENTIVIFTSDHGDMMFSQNRGWKSKPWRESVGVPLLVRWPGHIPSERVSAAPLGLVDLMPTLLGMLGLPIPASVDGFDYSAFLLGDESAAPESQLISFPCMPAWFRDPAWRGVVTSEFTYAATPDQPWLLYHDREDFFQLNNLVNHPDYQTEQQRLAGLLKKWLEKTQDDFPDSRTIADRYCPNHVDNVLPPKPLPEVIARGPQRQ